MHGRFNPAAAKVVPNHLANLTVMPFYESKHARPCAAQRETDESGLSRCRKGFGQTRNH